jgi:hypothetical protein
MGMPGNSPMIVEQELTDLSTLLAGIAHPGNAPHEGIRVATRDFREEWAVRRRQRRHQTCCPSGGCRMPANRRGR